MSQVILTSFKDRPSHKKDTDLALIATNNPKVVYVSDSDILETVPRTDKGFGSILKTSLAGKGGRRHFHIYESPVQVEVAQNPDAANPYEQDMDLAVSAAGSAIGDSPTLLTKYLSEVTTCIDADDDNGVQLSAASTNRVQVVINSSSAAIEVYPDTVSAYIGTLATASGVPATVTVGQRKHFVSDGLGPDSQWKEALDLN